MSVLASLRSKHPLPEGWSEAVGADDVIVADGIELYRAGLSASAGTDEVTGAAASTDGAPLARAYFELVERATTLAALRARPDVVDLWSADGEPAGKAAAADVFPESAEPAVWRYARSNGVALRDDWPSACRHALWELCERDRILRSWYGEIVPEAVALPTSFPVFAKTSRYEWVARTFRAEGSAAWSAGVEVCAIFGFPLDRGAPLVAGYGARPTIGEALAAAAVEVTQGLAFLWDESIPEVEPAPLPAAMAHLERFLVPENHGRVRAWLDGAHASYRDERPRPPEPVAPVTFVDLGALGGLAGGLRVAKAVCASALPLTFGVSPLGAHLPPDLRLHPVA